MCVQSQECRDGVVTTSVRHWKAEEWPLGIGEDLEFTLVYEGPLLAHHEVREKAHHKHSIRKYFHPQLRTLWRQKLDHWLIGTQVSKTKRLWNAGPPIVEQIAANFSTGPFNFVPLVTEQLVIACKIDILFLHH